MLKKDFIMRTIFKTIVAFIAAGAMCTPSFAESKTDGSYILTLKASKEGAIYNVGDTSEFVLRVVKEGKCVDNIEVSARVSKEGVLPQKFFVEKTKNGEVRIFESLSEPGFLRCEASVKIPGEDGKEKQINLTAGAGFEPLRIESSMPKPDDFDAYWKEEIAHLETVPMNIRLKPVEQADKSVELFDISVDMQQGLLSGYYARPKGAGAKSCPAIILPHGAGVRSSRAEPSIGWAKRGFIALDFNAHGIPNGMPESFYKKLAAGELKGYFIFGKHNRDESYMRKIFLRAYRALEAVKAQPEWDGKNLVAFGTSQGGAQSIFAAGACKDVSLAVIFVAGMCDNTAVKVGRAVGGGWFVAKNALPLKIDDAAIEPSRYTDCVNFARNIKCPTIWIIDLADTTCVPSSQFAAYNAVTSPKEFYTNEEAGHKVPEKCYQIMVDKVLSIVKKNK